MVTRILPLEEVIQRTGLSRRTLYTEMSEGRFPKGVQLTARRVGWPEQDIESWAAEKIAARDGAHA